MKLLLFFFAVCGAVVAETISTPSEITLASGAILKKATVTRWEKDQVVIKYQGGIAPVKFLHMAPASRAEFEAIKTKEFECKGSLYVVTRGAGTYKLGNQSIRVFVIQGKNEVTARTDADGKFSFKWVGPENFTIRVVASRMAGGKPEVYGWELKRDAFPNLGDMQLSNHNMTH